MRLFNAILLLLVACFLWAWLHVADVVQINHHDDAQAKPAVVTPPPPPPAPAPAKKTRAKDLRLNFNGKSLLGDNEQFEFATGATSPNLSAANNNYLARVADYLKKNPKSKLTLIGKFLPSEKNTSIYDNMGIARAASVRELLVKRGIANDRFDLQGRRVNAGQMKEPVSFSIFVPKEDTKLAASKSSFEDMDFSDTNFDYNSDVFKPGQGFLNWANQAKKYLAENRTKRLIVTGHTDSDGSEVYNKDLGQRRAIAVQRYLQNLGIKNNIIPQSKGEAQPIANNDTDANKRRNRRVNIQIK